MHKWGAHDAHQMTEVLISEYSIISVGSGQMRSLQVIR